MWYPTLNAKQKQQTMLDTFGGYNHTARPAEAEFYDMQNMTGDDFPLLSTRGKRGLLPVTDEYVGHMAKDGKLLCLKESGTETLKLTVKDAVEAAELPEVPENVTIEEPNVSLDVYSEVDLQNEGINFKSRNWRYNDREAIKGILAVTMASCTSENLWTITLDHSRRDLISIDRGDVGTLDCTEYLERTSWYNVIEKDISITDGYLVGCINGLESHVMDFYNETINQFSGERIVGLDGSINVYEYLNGVKVRTITFDGFKGVRFEITNLEVNDGRKKVWYRIPFDDLFGQYNSVHSYECEWIDGRIRANIYYPIVDVRSGCHYSKQEYEASVVEANAQYKEALEQYNEEKKTHITLNETLTAEVAAKIKGTTIQIGDADFLIQNATAGKSGEGELIIEKPHGAIAAGAQVDVGAPYLSLCEIDPQTGAEVSAPIGLINAEGERTMISMGAMIVVFPDLIEVNTMERSADGAYTECGPLELSSEIRGNTEEANLSVLIALCDAQYRYIGAPTVSKTAPSSPTTGQYWLDNSKTDVHLKVFSESTNMWTEVETYLKIYSVDLNAGFEAGDAVRVLDGAKAWTHDSVSFLDEGDSHILFDAGEESLPDSLSETYGHMKRRYIVVRGILKDVAEDETATVSPAQSNDVCMTIRRTVPDLDYIVESGNRLWGCHYGKNADGETVNELYACKLGDPKNWFSYEGTAMDSYTASLGTDGPFTGAAVYAGNPVFFKENYMHRVYGSYPANYQILTQAVHGVQQGCAPSLAVVNERLFYKAQDGIYVYDGSIPYLMSEVFGQRAYSRAIGADGNGKYYVSLEKPDGTRDLMVYDLQKRMWYREDDLPVRYLIPLGNTLIAVTRDRQMIDLLGRNGEAEPDFEWYAESGNIGYAIAAKKFVGRMLLRMELSDGAYVRVQIAYDNDRAYTDLYTSSEAGVGTICVPVRPHRCDHFRVRISGKGAAKLISITKTIKGGSER